MKDNRIKIKPIIYSDNKILTHEIKMNHGKIGILKDSEHFKAFKSDNYNYFFDKNTGEFYRWGKNSEKSKQIDAISTIAGKLYVAWKYIWDDKKLKIEDFVNDLETDGDFDNTVVEIVDWEISELCSMGCSFCYKNNTINGGKNISFEEFKITFSKLPPTVISIAYGIGSISLCPDLWKILNYTREYGIIPTITINGDATEDELNKLSNVVGACAVSVYGDKQNAYNCIKGLTNRGLDQCNIHFMICEETYDKAFEIINDIKTDYRLSNLRAIVLLSLKNKGRSFGKFNKLSQEKFDKLFKYILDNEISCGFDSCSSAKVFNFINKNPQYQYMKTYIEPCEAGGKYSSYINVNCDYFPCSFAEGVDEWKNGISVLKCDDFMKDVWYNEKTIKFGNCVKKCRECNIGCPIYDI